MKSAWVIDKEMIEIREEDYPKPAEEEVVVKIQACGICGTDLHFFNDYPENRPMPLGHEVSGLVYEVGSDVRGFSPGDQVIVQNHVPCGRCESCLRGNVAHCRNIQTYMSDRSGMAEYLRARREMIVPCSNLSFIEAAIAEPLTVALDLMRETRLEPFQNLCISGPGIIGLFCTGLARIAGAGTIIMLGRRGHTARGKRRIEAARELGADLAYDTDEAGWKERFQEEAPLFIERFIVTSPPRTIPEVLPLASFGSSIIFNGISFREESITFNANDFHFKKLRLIASHAIPNWGFPLAFKLLSQHRFGQERLITHTFSFDRIEEAFHVARSADEPVIKVVVTFPE